MVTRGAAPRRSLRRRVTASERALPAAGKPLIAGSLTHGSLPERAQRGVDGRVDVRLGVSRGDERRFEL